MTFQRLLFLLVNRKIKPEAAEKMITEPDKLEKINYYAHWNNISRDNIPEDALQEMESIVNILQVLYNSSVGSPISDPTYDMLQENLISMGVPRLTGSIELNDLNKREHRFTQLRGTLEKIYYLYPDEDRTNPSRRYLHEWIKSATSIIRQRDQSIDLLRERVMLQPKFDGISAELETDGKYWLWLLRGDTSMNTASDVSHILGYFNKLFPAESLTGVKTEIIMTEEKKEQLCKMLNQDYTSSRQLVAAILNSLNPDFRVEFLTPVPLRIIREGEPIESIHPDLISKFPIEICELGDLIAIKRYAELVRNLEVDGEHYPTDGIVITFLNPRVQSLLGRSNNINRFEVAYKYSGEEKYSRVRDVEFYVSQFGYITPVLVVEDVKMKGRTINHISLSNKERFDELGLCYGDEVKVYYEIIPYVTLDKKCRRDPNKRKIRFVSKCPECGTELDLNQTEVRCPNPDCKCRRVGKILNYCEGVRIKNIGYQMLAQLYDAGYLKKIRDLYHLKKKADKIALLPGFGIVKAKKMVAEIEARKTMPDWQFFGSIGIEDASAATFKAIFSRIELESFLEMVENRKLVELQSELIKIPSIGPTKAKTIVSTFNTVDKREELFRLLKEVNIVPSKNVKIRGRVVFSGCRPDDEVRQFLESIGYEPSDTWSNSAVYLIIPHREYTSSKVKKAEDKGIPIATMSEIRSVIK